MSLLQVWPVSNVVLLPCSTVALLQHDTSTTWFQTSDFRIQSNRTAAAEK